MKRSHIWGILIAVLTVVLTFLGHIGIREWYKADVRYEEGSWYHSEDQSLTSLKLTNFGHADAEEIRVKAVFKDLIREATSSEDGFPFTVTGGGKGSKTVTGTIDRLVPGQTLYIYIATNRPEVTTSSQSFVDSVFFRGGTGRRGSQDIAARMVLWAAAILTVLTCVIVFFLIRKARQIEVNIAGISVSLGQTLGILESVSTHVEDNDPEHPKKIDKG